MGSEMCIRDRGETEDDVAKPFVGVVSTWNEAAPCNTALMRQAQSVKKGVKEYGGTPREFCTITVTDGIAMGHEGMKSSLVSREIKTTPRGAGRLGPRKFMCCNGPPRRVALVGAVGFPPFLFD